MEGIIQWSPGVTLESVEKQIILVAFRHYRGNKSATANSLGITVRTLENKFEKYEDDKKVEKEREDNDRKQREEFLARQRGANTPNYLDTAETLSKPGEEQVLSQDSLDRIRLQSPQDSSAEPSMPVPKRAAVQEVLPKDNARSGNGGRR